jgi:hydroxymethylpyrimidine kinase/phosphomethylpyrimidine kinase
MTRQRAPVSPPVVLTVAGSDSGGGAGIQADLKTIEAGGAFGTSVITSVTAQHTRGVESTHVLPIDEIEAQYEAVTGDFEVAAVKTGMLATTEVVELVTDRVADLDSPAVVDPVMVAASGDRLLDREAEAAYEELAREAALLTPNADEAEVLTGESIESPADAQRAGEQLIEDGVGAVLVKGGHVDGEEIVDVLVTEEGAERIRHPRVDTDATHGSGCTLSSAVATRLAYGDDLATAVRTGIDLLGRAVRYSIDVGQGPGSVHHMVAVRDRAEREPTAEAVHGIVREFVEMDVSPLVAEVGMNVVGATPYAESPGECAAVEGRISRTLDGVEPTGGVRFGASSHVARLLLAAREHEVDYRYAANCRFDESVELALESLGWPVGSYDRRDQPEEVRAAEGATMGWGARQAFSDIAESPVAVSDRGAHGQEPTTTVFAADPATLIDRVRTLLETVAE